MLPPFPNSYPWAIGLDKGGYQAHNVNSFLISPQNVCCGYSLEAPRQGTSNEYLQHMFSSRNKKNIATFWLKKVPYQELCPGLLMDYS